MPYISLFAGNASPSGSKENGIHIRISSHTAASSVIVQLSNLILLPSIFPYLVYIFFCSSVSWASWELSKANACVILSSTGVFAANTGTAASRIIHAHAVMAGIWNLFCGFACILWFSFSRQFSILSFCLLSRCILL